jgi:3-oxoacyl-[acyl-carrier protein] reductase
MRAVMVDKSFAGKTALVTGGSRGIGLAVVRRLHHAGARVVVCGRNAKSLVAAAKQVGEIVCVPCDVRGDLKRLFKAVDRLDLLVNNAGGLEHRGRFEDTPLEAWRSTFELNLFGAVSVTRAALPFLRRSGGCVVNIASDVGRRPFRMGPDYCAAKAALINLTRYLARELAPVRVNVVCPGPIDTGNWSSRDVRQAAARTLRGRTGTPEEVADAVMFAATCGFLNGAVCGVDGGTVRTP